MIKGYRFLVLGRAGMDLYPDVGQKIVSAELMRPALGGSSGNIAAGLSRLGAEVELLGLVSRDPVGDFVRRACKEYGIGTRYLADAPKGLNTNLALAENVLEDFEVVIYRNSAADLALDTTHIEAVDFADFSALVFTGTALSKEPSRSATHEAMRRAVISVFDIDYRPSAWQDAAEAGRVFEKTAQKADIVIGNDEEFGLIGGLEVARSLGQQKLVIYKMGEKGAIVIDCGEEFSVPIFPIQALKPVGAGDAFMAGFLVALAAQKTVLRAVQEGAANASIVVSRPGCAPAMATEAELQEFLQQRGL